MSQITPMNKSHFQLTRDAFGRLVLTNAEGEVFEGVVPVRAYPIQAPQDGVALVHTDGHEVGWLDRLTTPPRRFRP